LDSWLQTVSFFTTWQCGLIMFPNEFISVATQLLAGEGEGRSGSAVSRAYYGAFHFGKQFLSECGVIIGIDAMAHRNVRWCLANSSEQRIKNLGKILEHLRKARNDADYELASTRFVHRSAARAEVERAVEIFTVVAAYRSDEARNHVAPSVGAYASKIGLPVRNIP
jgi:uncharacterized protein (UPF0332 family)